MHMRMRVHGRRDDTHEEDQIPISSSSGSLCYPRNVFVSLALRQCDTIDPTRIGSGMNPKVGEVHPAKAMTIGRGRVHRLSSPRE